MQRGWRGRTFHVLRSVTPAQSFTKGLATLEFLGPGFRDMRGLGIWMNRYADWEMVERIFWVKVGK